MNEYFDEKKTNNKKNKSRKKKPEELNRRGAVEAGATFYHNGDMKISSFVLKPTEKITSPDGDIIVCNVVTETRTYKNIQFHRDVFNSKKSFLRALKYNDLLYTGTDDNVQGILDIVNKFDVPTTPATKNLGYNTHGKHKMWVDKNGIICAPESTRLKYVTSGSPLETRTVYNTEPIDLTSTILDIQNLNNKTVTLPIIGWFFATPFAPRIAQKLGHFPILFVWGTHGAGKTSIITQIFWRLFGISQVDPFSATETEFALLRLLSGTDSIPIVIDEYKPYDMAAYRRNTLHRYMRRVYNCETEQRGRPDLTLQTYRLCAPLCVIGETRPDESALLERILPVRPTKNALEENDIYRDTFHRLREQPLNNFASKYIQYTLTADFELLMERAENTISTFLASQKVPNRIRDNLLAMAIGMHGYADFAAKNKIPIDIEDIKINLTLAMTGILDDLMDREPGHNSGSNVKTPLDRFLEYCAALAHNGHLRRGVNYETKNNELRIHMASTYQVYSEHFRRADSSGERPDKLALMRMARELHKSGGYIENCSKSVTFSSQQTVRVLVVNLKNVVSNMDLDGFVSSINTDTY